jgi:hypothetical protein
VNFTDEYSCLISEVTCLSDSICSRLLSWFGSLIIKNIPKVGLSASKCLRICTNSNVYECLCLKIVQSPVVLLLTLVMKIAYIGIISQRVSI